MWKTTGSKKTDAKYFGNVIHEPVFECYGDSLIIDIIPFPDLYLLIVPVTTMYTKLHEVIFTFLIVNYISLFVNNY